MTDPQNHERRNGTREPLDTRAWLFRIFLILVLLFVAALGWVGLRLQGSGIPGVPADPDSTPGGASFEESQSGTPDSQRLALAISPIPVSSTQPGALYFTARMGGHSHLMLYIPGEQRPLLLQPGLWDDISPAVSPDGKRLAFASNRSGRWELYLLDLASGAMRALTDTPGYEGRPTWSPDGQWLAYEAYYDGDLDVWILSVDGTQPPIQLTDHPAADHSPAWDPGGRRIAFISTRDQSADLFLADLDQPDERFRNLTQTDELAERDPAFSLDGLRLAYSASAEGLDLIHILTVEAPEPNPETVGQGISPAWRPDGSVLASLYRTPYETYLQAIIVSDSAISQPGLPSFVGLQDVTWASFAPPEAYLNTVRELITPTELYATPSASPDSFGRYELMSLPDVSAPNPLLSDTVDERFIALHDRAFDAIGWDFLAVLENAFVGLNEPLPPGLEYNAWLYTGRAFAFNRAAVQAGWVEFIREDFGGKTYWGVYVRARAQDGSLGAPLRDYPWDFETRAGDDPVAYDEGGSYKTVIPRGYYVDFTRLASDYGFNRLPALPNWRTYYLGARFHEFTSDEGLEWIEAMLELYPESAIITPTPYRTPTSTPTRTPRPTPTPWWWRWRTPTSSPTPTEIPSATATATPSPGTESP